MSVSDSVLSAMERTSVPIATGRAVCVAGSAWGRRSAAACGRGANAWETRRATRDVARSPFGQVAEGPRQNGVGKRTRFIIEEFVGVVCVSAAVAVRCTDGVDGQANVVRVFADLPPVRTFMGCDATGAVCESGGVIREFATMGWRSTSAACDAGGGVCGLKFVRSVCGAVA
jgi:hypothetical protein